MQFPFIVFQVRLLMNLIYFLQIQKTFSLIYLVVILILRYYQVTSIQNQEAWYISVQPTAEQTQFESLTSFCGMKQNSKKFLKLYRSFFTNQANLIMDLRVHPTLHSKCNHQIIYSKLKLEIKYPPSYASEVQDYGKAQFDLINVVIENFDRNKHLSGNNIRNQINLFHRTIFNIFQNFSPNMDILYNDKESPWANDELHYWLREKKLNIQIYPRDNRLVFSILNKLSDVLTIVLTSLKLGSQRKIAAELNDPNTTLKRY